MKKDKEALMHEQRADRQARDKTAPRTPVDIARSAQYIADAALIAQTNRSYMSDAALISLANHADRRRVAAREGGAHARSKPRASRNRGGRGQGAQNRQRLADGIGPCGARARAVKWLANDPERHNGPLASVVTRRKTGVLVQACRQHCAASHGRAHRVM